MGKSNFELLKIAQKHLGQGGARFRKFCGLPAGSAWCNAYVDYIAHEGDDSDLYFDGKRPTYCPTSMKWCQNHLAQIPIYLAMPMDIIYFDWEPNGVPNHIGFVRERKTDQEIYTIEGNTSGGVVAQKTRTVKYVCGCYRPHFKATFDATKKLEADGFFGYNSIAVMQKWLGVTVDGILGLGTVKALQKKLGVAQDGSWGRGTSKALQKLIGTPADGDFGPKSVKAFQQYLNKAVFKVTETKPTTKPATTKKPATKAPNKTAQRIVDNAIKYAYPYGTVKSKYDYKTGKPLPAYSKACKSNAKITQSDCGYFVKTVNSHSGVGSFNPNDDKCPSTMALVIKGRKVKESELKPGDEIQYKKEKGQQHTFIYLGGGKIAEAGRGIRFPRIYNFSKYNAKSVKHNTTKVYRAK